MSFYGNISNAGKTQMSFDKIYPNRYTMDSNISTDEVLIGRYVLVEYDDNTNSRRTAYIAAAPMSTFPEEGVDQEEQQNPDQYILYADIDCTIPLKLTESSIEAGYGLQAGDIAVANFNNINYYFQCTGKVQETTNYAYFSFIVSQNEITNDENANVSDYTINYKRDKDYSKEKNMPFSAGWDSTIWQKVYKNGKEQYIMIASLNSVTPSFKVVSEPPSEVPIAPHFGENSTNLEYNLHVQPTWGFKIKEAENEDVSDIDIPYLGVDVDPETGEEIEVMKTYPGSIFYNEAGFNDEIISYSDIDNETFISPTGISGKKYIMHNAETGEVITSEAPDMQEFVMNLPAIGNTIAKVWDLVYGDEDINRGKYRNKNVTWGNSNGLRMVDRQIGGNGFDFFPNHATTVAGAINSMNDLIGTIISSAPAPNQTIEEALEAATSTRIYHGALTPYSARKGYYFKDTAYKFTSFEDKIAEDPDFDPDEYVGSRVYYDLTQFEPGIYYTYVDENFYRENSDTPTEDTQYYKLGEPLPITIKKWQDESEETDEETGEIIIVTNYVYYKTEDLDYIKDTSETPSAAQDYYSIEVLPMTNPDPSFVETKVEIYAPKEHKIISYSPEDYIDPLDVITNNIEEIRSGYFYATKEEIENEDGELVQIYKSLVALTEEDINNYQSDREHFYIDRYAVAKGSDSQGVINEVLYFINADGKALSFTNTIIEQPEFLKQYKIDLIPFIKNTYYSEYIKTDDQPLEGYKCLHSQEDIDNTIVYYTIEATFAASGATSPSGGSGGGGSEEESEHIYFYQPGNFFYITAEGDYILDYSKVYNEEKEIQYYFLTDKNNILLKRDSETKLFIIDPEDVLFYEPGEYYYRSLKFEADILDNSVIMKTPESEDVDPDYVSEGRVYYIPQKAYVIEDTAGVLSKGQVWDKNTDPPDTVTLGVREEVYQWKELKGFSKTLNTINGLILTLNKLYKFDDEYTRDDDTIQGCLNVLKDTLNILGALNPKDFLMVDDYGRVIGGHFVTDAWLSAIPNGALSDPSVALTHQKAQNVVTNVGVSGNATLQFGKSFDIGGFGIDAKGHVVESSLSGGQATLPPLAISNSTSGNIVTNIQISEDGQSFVVNKNNIGALPIAGYNIATASDSLKATDSLNAALGKLEYKVNILNGDVTQVGSIAYQIAEIVNENNNGSIDTLNEIASWIINDTTGAAKIAQDVADNAAAIILLNTKISDDKISQWDAAETNVQGDWAETDEASDAFIVNKPNLDNVIKTDTTFNYTYNEISNTMTIDDLMAHIALLEKRIYDLENPSVSS